MTLNKQIECQKTKRKKSSGRVLRKSRYFLSILSLDLKPSENKNLAGSFRDLVLLVQAHASVKVHDCRRKHKHMPDLVRRAKQIEAPRKASLWKARDVDNHTCSVEKKHKGHTHRKRNRRVVPWQNEENVECWEYATCNHDNEDGHSLDIEFRIGKEVKQWTNETNGAKKKDHRQIDNLQLRKTVEAVIDWRDEAPDNQSRDAEVVKRCEPLIDRVVTVTLEGMEESAAPQAHASACAGDEEDTVVDPVRNEQLAYDVNAEPHHNDQSNEVRPDIPRLIVNRKDASKDHGSGVESPVGPMDEIIVALPCRDFVKAIERQMSCLDSRLGDHRTLVVRHNAHGRRRVRRLHLSCAGCSRCFHSSALKKKVMVIMK